MGKDKRQWRKLVKKLRRQKKRRKLAQQEAKRLLEKGENTDSLETVDYDDRLSLASEYNGENEGETADGLFFITRKEWEEREEEVRLENALKKVEEERLAEIEANERVGTFNENVSYSLTVL